MIERLVLKLQSAMLHNGDASLSIDSPLFPRPAKKISNDVNSKGCLAVRVFTLRLNPNKFVNTKRISNSRYAEKLFVICLLECKEKIYQSEVIMVDLKQFTRSEDIGDGHSIDFEFNKIFDNLDPDFEINVKFYTMTHLALVDDRKPKIGSTSNIIRKQTFFHIFQKFMTPFKLLKNARFSQFLSNQEPVQPKSTLNPNHSGSISTQFKLLGEIVLNINNFDKIYVTMDNFDCLPPFDNWLQMDNCLNIFYQNQSVIRFKTLFDIKIHHHDGNLHELGDQGNKLFSFRSLKAKPSKIIIDGQDMKVYKRNANNESANLVFDLSLCLNHVLDQTHFQMDDVFVMVDENISICLIFLDKPLVDDETSPSFLENGEMISKETNQDPTDVDGNYNM